MPRRRRFQVYLRDHCVFTSSLVIESLTMVSIQFREHTFKGTSPPRKTVMPTRQSEDRQIIFFLRTQIALQPWLPTQY